MIRRLKIDIQGTVQGIGFRPFVYKLAHEKQLFGYVSNTGAGVDIEVEGDPVRLDLFVAAIESHRPPLAHITAMRLGPVSVKGDRKFVIKESATDREKMTSIPPDIAICPDCLNELQTPGDRRYRYPFINCTNCGPRYTIIEDIPYDRAYTSMRNFDMCPDCMKEYTDPFNRRFHAQPNACPVCGPRVSLYDNGRQPVTASDPVASTVDLLREGYIVAVKGLGGFHLSVDAENSRAVKSLRQRKHREEKPLALMALDLDRIRRFARVGPAEERLLTAASRPIVILEKKTPNSICNEVAPHHRSFGVMLPYTPLHYLLLDSDLAALVMTSGNISQEPIAIDNTDAFNRLGSVADYFLVHNRDICLRVDDGIVRQIDGKPRMIRRARGFAPSPVYLKAPFPQILACGAETANTVCLTKGVRAVISQHIGDLTNLECLNSFEHTIAHLKRVFDISPELVAHDLHPDYLSTRFARQQTDVKIVGVQHHHAHIAGCMCEHGIEAPVIGLAFDGTGYGTDGRIWGGEVLYVRPGRFDRLAHLEYLPMPGGNAAITSPWRMALSYLRHVFGDSLWDLKLPLFQHIDERRIRFVLNMMETGVNCPHTSSLGRLFDGVSALSGIRYRVSYEGQAAIELEAATSGAGGEPFPYDYQKENGIYRISVAGMIRGVSEAVSKGARVSAISSRFHQTLIQLFTNLCTDLRRDTGCNRIVFSGGVFQNAVLLKGLGAMLKENGFSVFSHSKVPTNDGGIAFGQAAVAAAINWKRGDSHVFGGSHEGS